MALYYSRFPEPRTSPAASATGVLVHDLSSLREIPRFNIFQEDNVSATTMGLTIKRRSRTLRPSGSQIFASFAMAAWQEWHRARPLHSSGNRTGSEHTDNFIGWAVAPRDKQAQEEQQRQPHRLCLPLQDSTTVGESLSFVALFICC